ncbi:MAG: patatin-like phospholipase family protein [Pseudomonadota bacterium]
MAIFGGMSLDVVPALASIKFLEDVPKRALKAAGKEARWFSIPAGWPLFEVGEVSDSIFFVLTGSLGAFKRMPNGRSEFLGHIRAGEPVGEMAMFRGGIDINGDGDPDNVAHTSSVYALRDTEVLEISRQGFTRLTAAEPDILSAIIRLILSRLSEGNQRNRRTAPKVFALIGTSPTIDLNVHASALKTALAKLGVSARVIDEAEGDEKPSAFFEEAEQSNDIVILTTPIGDTAWYRLATRQADRLWVMARADARPSYPLLPEDNSPAQTLKLVDVILIHNDGERQASKPSEWLNACGGARVFHWQQIHGPSCDRLARTMSGRSIGVVFSGGGARAYAHIGVVRAIRELGLPIDFAGGASMGAVVAGCVAMGWDDDEIDRRIRKGFVETNPLGDWRLPVVSMVKGHRVDNRLNEHFGQAEIGDLDIPFFAVSTNLTDGAYRIHRRGLLRKALRASIALPGILPPVIDNGEVLVDGAVLNNFPADVMREFQRGFVIGCDVTRAPQGLNTEDFIDPPGFFGWVRRNGLSSAPPIAGLLMRSATVSYNPNMGRDLVDVLALPELEDIELRDWKAYDATVEAGYTAAMAVLKESDLLEQCCTKQGKQGP